MEVDIYDEEDEQGKIFCLEIVEDIEEENTSDLFTFLEHLALNFKLTSVYKTCDSFEGFEDSISNLLFHDRDFRDYNFIYLVVSGENNQVQIDDYFYSLEEIAELFQGKLTDKIVHFANTKNLELDEETFQYFLAVTGVKAISGYVNSATTFSSVLDQYYFTLANQHDDVVDLVHALFEKDASLCMKLGFRLYY